MRFLKANKLFNGKQFLAPTAVLVLDDQNKLIEISDTAIVQNNKIEFFDGIITPGFVNAHCHLELSHLKNKIEQHTGIPEFAKQIIHQRAIAYTKEQIHGCAKAADNEMWANGVVAVGDISNGDDSFKVKQDSKIFYHTFVEVMGLNPINETNIFNYGLSFLEQLKQFNLVGSLSPHAPYSSSLQLIEHIANYNKEHNLPLTIHNQETEEETHFFLGNKSDFAKLYDFLKLDISWFKAPQLSSLAYYINAINKQSILVHNTCSSKNDISMAIDKNCFFCFCPNANLYIENKLPNFNLFKDAINTSCIGTDSLASNHLLNLISEVNVLLSHTTIFTVENSLQMLTYNGAAALNITDSFGQLILGKNTGLNLIDQKNGQLLFKEKLT